MKTFSSFLARYLEEYLRYRHALGYDTRNTRQYLRVFDGYLRKVNADWNDLKPSFFLEMTANLHRQPGYVNQIVSSTRVFFRFLVRREILPDNPLQDVPLLRENTVVPFVFTPEQTDQLLQAASRRIRRQENYFLVDLGLFTAMVLLARCGMRISEPLKLLRQHYCRDDATVFIARTKFNKQRLVPLPKAAIKELENYLAVRRRLMVRDTNPYLLADVKGALSIHQLRRRFNNARTDIGLHQPRRVVGNLNICRPTPHSLRHAFAINTLLSIKQRAGSAQGALPVLAAYLGHSHYRYTAVYLRVANAISRKRLVDFALWQLKRH